MANLKISELPTGSSTMTASDVMIANVGGVTKQLSIPVLQYKFNNGVDPVDYGAVADNSTEDTTAIQSAINALPEGGIIDGRGRTYAVGRINLKSNMTFRNFNFEVKFGLSTQYTTPVTIGDNNDTSARQNITIENVHVDGHRGLHSAITGHEDGGRHGFAIRGKVKNVLIDRCTAKNCASDGIILYSGLSTRTGVSAVAPYTTTNMPLMRNIYVRDCMFTENRRLGGSGDSLMNVKFENCEFRDNGKSASGSLSGALSTAPRGGFDLEGYDVGSTCQNVWFDNCIFSSAGSTDQTFVCLAQQDQSASGWVHNSRIRFTDCQFGHLGTCAVGTMVMTSEIADKTLSAQYHDVSVENCTIYGYYTFRCCNKVTLAGGVMYNSVSDAGVLDYTSGVVAQRATSLSGLTFVSVLAASATYI